MSDVPAEFLALFRDEANGRLDSMVDSLLALEAGRAEARAAQRGVGEERLANAGGGEVGL